MDPNEKTAWIFVSHASADLKQVREVRNYLESRGGAPLLFHLKALTQPEEFWPIIEREIAARNFFLYCESSNAERSEWVQRERQTVEAVRKQRSVRIGSIRVDQDALETGHLDRFLADTRVFPTYSHKDRVLVQPFIQAIRDAGFQVFDALTDMPLAVDFRRQVAQEIDNAAANGWIVGFVTANALASQWVSYEIEYARSVGGRFLPVLLEPVALPPPLNLLQHLDATRDVPGAISRLVNELLTRS
jgi:hypothetical protein